jgi:hypothetical protein
MLTLVRRAALLAVALTLVVLVPAGAAPAAKKAAGCKPGFVPKKGSTKKVVCVKFTLPAGTRPAAAPRTAQGELAQITDQLQAALDLNPAARARLDKKVGKRRASKVVALALEGWQKKAGIAAATQSQTQSFGSAGAGGTAKLDIGAYDDGRSGWKVAAEAEVELTRSGLDKLGGGDVLPSGIDGGKARVKLTFNDILAACPSAAGTVAGRLEASGSLSIDIKTSDGTVSVDLAASAAMTYVVKVGENGKWYKIDDTTMKTKFSSGGTGQKTKSYYGNVAAGGYGTDSILDAPSGGVKGAVERDLALGMAGGSSSVSGPMGTWSLKGGKEKVDVASLLDYKPMMASYIATQMINLAAMEYLRKVALPRGQKHWYDEEGCLTVDGSAAPSDKLKPGATATVTVSGVKARDGGPVPGALTASGVASLVPGSASVAPGGSAAFTLTAPGAPGPATWQVVVVSRGGKKTVSGSIPVKKDDLPMSYTGSFSGTEVASGSTGPSKDQNWDGTLTFTRTSQDDFPDGSRNAWYKLSAASLTMTDVMHVGACGDYKYTGVGAEVVGGDLELQVTPDGVATAAFTADVSFGDQAHAGVGLKPRECPGSIPPNLTKVVLNSRNSTNSLRPVAPGFALTMAPATTDLATNAFSMGYVTQTAAWDLKPGY